MNTTQKQAEAKRAKRAARNLELVRKGALQLAVVAPSAAEELIDEKLAELLVTE